MRQGLVYAARRHHVAAEKNLHERRLFREADRTRFTTCESFEPVRLAKGRGAISGVAAITSSISLAGRRAASRARTARAAASESTPGS